MANPFGDLFNELNTYTKENLTNRGLNTTGSKMYFIKLATGNSKREVMEIQFIPSDITHTRKGKWATAEIVGRNEPRYQYVGGETELSFTLDFIADEESRTSVMRKCQWLQSLIANDTYRRKAPRIILVMGDMYKKEKWIVANADVKYDMLSRPNGFMPQQAYVDITLKLDPDRNTSWNDMQRPYMDGEPDGANPINLGEIILGGGRGKLQSVASWSSPKLGNREADMEFVSDGNNWREIAYRFFQRYRISGSDNLWKNFI